MAQGLVRDFGGGEDIAFERIGKAGVVTLTRAKALNALTHDMVTALSAALSEWASDDSVALVVVKAEGRAFSAGGDILDVYRRGKAGEHPDGFFADEYRMNTLIANYPKPYVALIDGIVMGGGVGISFHGSHRVIGDNALFAMPEVGIGFFPDVGGSHILPALPGAFGRYLALTGDRIKPGDIAASGLGTHFVPSADHPALLDRLTADGNVEEVLAEFTTPAPHRQIGPQALLAIADIFSAPTFEEMIARLRDAATIDPVAAGFLETMEKRSPTSLAIAFRQLKEGEGRSMEDCMRTEFRILSRMLEGHDFYEGIRAALIDKGSTPQWNPAKIGDVSAADVDAYFAPLGERELQL